MRGIMEPGVEKYINGLLPPRDTVTREMEIYAARHDVPIIGPACGRVVYQLARLIRARRVFELGSAIGYSTLWLAKSVGPGGMVYYTDSDPANAERARAYHRRAGVQSRVTVMVGDALEMFDSTKGIFDLIFNDVNKTGYPDVFRRTLPRLRKGGLFITDNVLWSGRVAKPTARGDADTKAIKEFTKMIYCSPKLFTTIIPLRDGMAVCKKIA